MLDKLSKWLDGPDPTRPTEEGVPHHVALPLTCMVVFFFALATFSILGIHP